jgi:hypothetical protein
VIRSNSRIIYTVADNCRWEICALTGTFTKMYFAVRDGTDPRGGGPAGTSIRARGDLRQPAGGGFGELVVRHGNVPTRPGARHLEVGGDLDRAAKSRGFEIFLATERTFAVPAKGGRYPPVPWAAGTRLEPRVSMLSSARVTPDDGVVVATVVAHLEPEACEEDTQVLVWGVEKVDVEHR